MRSLAQDNWTSSKVTLEDAFSNHLKLVIAANEMKSLEKGMVK